MANRPPRRPNRIDRIDRLPQPPTRLPVTFQSGKYSGDWAGVFPSRTRPVTPPRPDTYDIPPPTGDIPADRAERRRWLKEQQEAFAESVRGPKSDLRAFRKESRLVDVNNTMLGRPYPSGDGRTAFLGERWNRGTNQSIADATNTTIQFGSNTFSLDRVGYTRVYDDTTYLWTIPRGLTGYWTLRGLARFDSNATGFRQVTVLINNTTTIYNFRKAGVAQENSMPIVLDWFFTEGEYFEVQVRQNSGGALNLIGGADSTFLTVEFGGV